jgi:4-amino-4-deoxy-L-arabinose transferase-like glycosyltransferase
MLVALLALAVGVRLLWAWWTAPVPPPNSDEEYYNAAALSLARGIGYHVTFGAGHWLPGGDPSSFWAPGFSAYLAIFYRAFGEHIAAARAANVLAGGLVVVPVYFVGRRLFGGEAQAVAGAMIAALLPSFVFWAPVLLSDTLFATLFAAAIAFFLCALPDSHDDAAPRLRTSFVIAGGIAVALATFVRGEALVLIPIVGVWWWAGGVRFRSAFLQSGVAGAIVVAAIAPWSVRNLIIFDEPILLSTNFGYNLRVGHAPYATGRYIVPQDLWDAQPGISFEDRELLFNRLGRKRAIEYAVDHPFAEVSLSARKVMWLWRPDSDALLHVQSYGLTPLPSGARMPLRLLLDVTYAAMLALAGITLWRYRSRRYALLFPVLLVAVWTAVHVVFFGEPRYHLPLLTVIAPMAGAALLPLVRPRPVDRAPQAGVPRTVEDAPLAR